MLNFTSLFEIALVRLGYFITLMVVTLDDALMKIYSRNMLNCSIFIRNFSL